MPRTATSREVPGDHQVVVSGIRLLTPAQVGEQIGASDDHVYRLIASGDLLAVDIAQQGARRSKTRIRSDDLERYIERRTRGKPPTNRDGTGPSRQAQRRPRRSQPLPNPSDKPGSDSAQPNADPN